jgi:glycosyltransferase involved in cell wall biosynthesis
LAREKLSILPRGLETEVFDLGHRNPDFWKKHGAQGKVVLYVGRISKEKELDFLAQVADRMKGDAGVTFAFVGDGPFLPELRQKVPRGIFTGALHGKELSQAYASADLFVFPSTTDTYGNVVIEALASGLPALVSDQGGPRELLRDPADGEVISGGSEAWERAIRRFLAPEGQLGDRAQRRKRTVAGRGWADAFTKFWTDGLL